MVIASHAPVYLFAGGGTGGHLTPGVAVAAALRESDPDCRIVFVGSQRAIEQQIVSASGFEQAPLTVEPPGTFLRSPARWLWRNARAWRASQRLVRELTPAAVIGLGGYASVPVALAAARAGTPVMLLEQNAIPGRANRFLARRAAAICTSFPDTPFPAGSRVTHTGNPVRAEIAGLFHQNRLPSDGLQVLLILGGSQGARGLNDAVCRMFADFPDLVRGLRIVHQTGPHDLERVRDAYARLTTDATIAPFFSDMAGLLGQATFVISRAGATTLAELACAGCPAVLVPFPHAVADHQTLNARYFASHGAARVVEQSDDPQVTAEHLAMALRELRGYPATHAAFLAALHSLARPRAAHVVVALLQKLVSDRKT